MDKKELKDFLRKKGIEFEEFKHPAFFRVEESKELRKEIPGLHCKCLFLKDNKGGTYLVGMSALKRLNIKKLRKKLRVRKLHFASEEELWRKLKLKPGSVSIFGLVNTKNNLSFSVPPTSKNLGEVRNNKDKDVMLILDKEVWDAERVGFHPNENTGTLVLEHRDLEKFYDSVKNKKEILELEK